MERNEETGKKLQQSGGAGGGSGCGEEYTRGGVKKKKFEPKVPTRRLNKVSALVKSEPREGLGDGEVPRELQRLLQQVESDGRGRDRPNQRTSKVAFGFSGFNSRSSGSFQRQRSAVGGGVGRSGGSVGLSGSGGAVGRGSGGVVIPVFEKQEILQADAIHVVDVKKGDLKNLEVFDHEKYYPVTLPLRKPLEGCGSQLLDEEEFGDGEDIVREEDEDGLEAARELGFTESQDEDTLFFFQFPKGLPIALNPSGMEKKASARSDKLEDLGKGGAMGKLLVYESGALQLKIGDVILDALPGTDCAFAQEVAGVNTTTKRCGFIGEVHKRVVLTPNITDVLPDLTHLRTNP